MFYGNVTCVRFVHPLNHPPLNVEQFDKSIVVRAVHPANIFPSLTFPSVTHENEPLGSVIDVSYVQFPNAPLSILVILDKSTEVNFVLLKQSLPNSVILEKSKLVNFVLVKACISTLVTVEGIVTLAKLVHP